MKEVTDTGFWTVEITRELIADGYRDIAGGRLDLPAGLVRLLQPPPGNTLTSILSVEPGERTFQLLSVPQDGEAKS